MGTWVLINESWYNIIKALFTYCDLAARWGRKFVGGARYLALVLYTDPRADW